MPKETINSSLIARGWQASDIEEAFSTANYPTLTHQVSNFPNKAPFQKRKIIVAFLVGIIIIGGGIYFVSQKFFSTEDPSAKANEISDQLPSSNTTETITPSNELAEQTQSQNLEIVFADNLSSCTKYRTTFTHPLTGETLEKEVLGVVNGKCNYIEQMPNGGKMECKYSEGERVAVAQYYKDVAMAETAGVKLSVDLGSDDQETTYTINGNVVDNPLQEATNSGVCVISGY